MRLEAIMRQSVLLAAACWALAGCARDVSGAGTPFLLTWLEGRCSGCKVATSLGSIQFTTGSEAWAIGDAWPPLGGEGLGEHVVVHTKDGGHTWAELSYTQMHAASPFVSFLDSARGWIGWGSPLGDLRLMRTRDGGENWQDVPGTFQPGPIFLDDSHWYAADVGKFLRTDDAGRTWHETRLAHLGFVNRMLFLSPSTGWIAGTYGNEFLVFQTADGGNTWKESRTAAPEQLTNVGDLFFLNPKRGWLITWHSLDNGSNLFGTLDGGATWTQEPDRSFQGKRKLAGVVRFLSESVGFVFENEESPSSNPHTPVAAQRRYTLVYTSDAGAHWHKQGIPNPVYDCQAFEGDLRCSAGGGSSGFNVLTVHPK